jgi:hypothetical protein
VGAPPDSSSSSSLPPPWQRAALSLVFVVFVAGWLVQGARGLVADDSRWAWGMFPYVLECRVQQVRFVDDAGHRRRWRPPHAPRLPRALRPGSTKHMQSYGYGKGAYDDLVGRVLDVAAKDAGAHDVAVEAVVVTRRSERPLVKATVRRALR